MSAETSNKASNLIKSFKRKEALNLNLNTEQSIELNNILCELATEEYKEGLDRGYKIAAKWKVN